MEGKKKMKKKKVKNWCRCQSVSWSEPPNNLSDLAPWLDPGLFHRFPEHYGGYENGQNDSEDYNAQANAENSPGPSSQTQEV